MKIWEWKHDDGRPAWVGLGDPCDHWGRRDTLDTPLNRWLCQFDECPVTDNTWLPSGSLKIERARQLARARVRQIQEWSGGPVPWLFNAQGCHWSPQGLARTGPDGVERYSTTLGAAEAVGLAPSTVVDYAWRGIHGWHYI